MGQTNTHFPLLTIRWANRGIDLLLFHNNTIQKIYRFINLKTVYNDKAKIE
jgi:hypothetical protein